MKNVLILFLLLASFALSAQEAEQSNKSILLRGKASTFFIIEDIYFNNWNIGLEYRFAERHSIGIDFVHFRWRFEHDIYIDGMETGYGPDSYSTRRYLLVDYRYYPFKGLMNSHKIDPYINPFVKMGRRKVWTNEPNTFYTDNDFMNIRNQRSDFTDYGLALGLNYNFTENDRIGLDVNIGAVYRELRILYEEQYDYDTEVFNERFSGNHSYWKFHMRLNLYFKLFKLKR